MEQKNLKTLLKSLSLDEKIGQLIQLSGEFYHSDDISMGPQRKLGITQKTVELSGSVLNVAGAKATREIQSEHLKKDKHSIPLMFMSDIIYGYKTVYPIPLGMGATWNPELIETAYHNTAEEAYAGGTQVALAPMVDLVRDARWGRVLESTGEDPQLNASFAGAMVRGFQQGLNNNKGIASCVKHFAAYGAVEAGREYNSADMSLSTLYQDYLPSYRAAVRAGVKMVMTSLTSLNGVPSTADQWLLLEILRKQWGFKGIIISDYASIFELIQHGFAVDEADAAKKSLQAGVDIDMKSPCYANGLKNLVTNNQLDEDKIDQAAWRVLSLKNELGLFEDPFRGASEKLEKTMIMTPAKRKVARQVSREALVLLKNDGILPLQKKKQEKIALIGPYADNHDLLGLWAVHGNRADTVTIADGLREYIPDQNLSVSQGTDIIRDTQLLHDLGLSSDFIHKVVAKEETEKQNNEEAIATASKSDLIIFACGEHTLQSGEAGSRTKLSLPKNQQKLFKRLVDLGKPIITIVISGRPLVLTSIAKKSNALIQAWFPGTEGGHALADVLVGKYNPSGRLSMSMPYVESQSPIYYNHLSTGRPEQTSQHKGRFVSRYIDAPVDPLYCFGYGLSYGSIEYHDIKLENSTIHKNEILKATISLENNGQYTRTEVVQAYFHDIVASVVQPVKRLVDFKKVSLTPGEKKVITFKIPAQKLGFYNRQGKYVVESGNFELFIGKNSNTSRSVKFCLD